MRLYCSVSSHVMTMYCTHCFTILIFTSIINSSLQVSSANSHHRYVETVPRARAQMDWWGLPDAVATAGRLFEYRLDQLTDDVGDDDEDYGSAAGDQPQALALDVYQVSQHQCVIRIILL